MQSHTKLLHSVCYMLLHCIYMTSDSELSSIMIEINRGFSPLWGMDKEKFLSAVSPQRCFHTPSAFFHKIPMRMACKKYPVSSKSGIRPDSKKHYPIHPYLEPKSDTVRVPSFAKCIDQHLSWVKLHTLSNSGISIFHHPFLKRFKSLIVLN